MSLDCCHSRFWIVYHSEDASNAHCYDHCHWNVPKVTCSGPFYLFIKLMYFTSDPAFTWEPLSKDKKNDIYPKSAQANSN